MDQWQRHMSLPQGVTFPAAERLEARGVTFDHQYCTAPICTPSRAAPGDGALYCWDGLHALDREWALSGALQSLTDMLGPPPAIDRRERLREAGERFGAPDFSKRTFYRAIVDGRHKLVRWFSPLEYANPCTVRDLYANADVSLYDLVNDSGELENLARPDHPRHDPVTVERMLRKLHALVERELGDDRAPFDLDLFGTREVRHAELGGGAGAERRTPCAPS
jgi:arylsulfatase